jgi:integrase
MGYIASKSGKDGKPRYYAVYKDRSGKRRWEAAGRYKKDAQSLLKRRESEVRTGIKPDDLIFSEFADKWLHEYAAANVKARTLEHYESAIRVHLKPVFGESRLKDICPEHVDTFKAAKLREGKAPATINKLLVVLGAIMKRAVIWRYIGENPVQYVSRVKLNHREMDYLTPEEILRLLEAASPEYRPLFATAVLTGAREGELLALRWGDLDLERRVLYIRRTYYPGHGFSEPKSASGRRAVKITPELVVILREHKETTGGRAGDLIFGSVNGNPIDATNMLAREFRPALERAGLRQIRFHDLRHTYAALQTASGENFKFIQQQMGHASISTTMDLYGHLLPEASKGAGERLDALVFSSNVLHFPTKTTTKADEKAHSQE